MCVARFLYANPVPWDFAREQLDVFLLMNNAFVSNHGKKLLSMEQVRTHQMLIHLQIDEEERFKASLASRMRLEDCVQK
jgi:hypothetical protein